MQSSVSNNPRRALNDNIGSSRGYLDAQRSARSDLAPLFGSDSIIHRITGITRQSLQKLTGDDARTRLTLAHLTMIAVAILAIGASYLELSWGTIAAVRPLKYSTTAAEVGTVDQVVTSLTLPEELVDSQNDVLVRAAVPRTIIPDRTLPEQASLAIKTYTVEPGDTISSIATKFGLVPETLIWSNLELEANPDLLWVGQQLIILPVDGVYHQVGGGDTIEGIASTFKADPAAIIELSLNELDSDDPIIRPGQWLIVPDGSKPFVPRTVTAYSGPVPANATIGTGIFGWPVSGSITNGFYAYHPGLDIGGWTGAPVLAADSGYVIATGWDNSGLGNMIVVDHGNGFQTVYGHLHAIQVETGANVSKGQQIAELGNTGNSTGPHLHFEIRQGTVQRNPFGFLP